MATRLVIPIKHEDFFMSSTLSPTVSHIGVGIDTARYGHRVTFLRPDRNRAAPPMTVTEDQTGYQQLRERLEELHRRYSDARLHVHIDAAGQYASNLQRFFQSLDLPLQISVGEPKRNKDYHKAFYPKRTTDDTESQAMARFAVVEQPTATPVTPEAFYVLTEIVNRLQGQVKDATRLTNRLHNLLARVFPELAKIADDLSAGWVLKLLHRYPTPARIAQARLQSLKKIPYIKAEQAEEIHKSAKDTVGSLKGELTESLVIELVERLQQCVAAEKRLEKLLVQAYEALPPSGHIHVNSIPGMGTAAAAVVVAKTVSIDRFQSAEKLVGYFGVFPEENKSGVDRNGEPLPQGTMRMSRKGSDVVRRYLWNAAKSAIQHNPAVRDLYARLRAKGTRGDVALGTCMRKLLHQVFVVWATNKPFDPEHSGRRNAISKLPSPNQPATQASKKEATGHKRDNPQSKVVTAANSKVEASAQTVKLDERSHSGSIDYTYLREQVTMEQVLSHIGHLQHLKGGGAERRGPCPLHGSQRDSSRTFSVNLTKNVYHCFHPECSKGNVLDFWQARQRLPLYESALHLAKTFNLQTNREQRRGARNEPVTPPQKSS